MYTALRRAIPASLALALLAGLSTGCGRTSPPPAAAGSTGARFRVVAAENFWGSIAAQLAGGKALVQSIVVNPSTDPHSYQPNAEDARAVASANMVIENGIGYDRWMRQLRGADGGGGRTVLSVGDLLGVAEGENPHQWYSPSSVSRVIDRIVADYVRLDPSDAAFFARQKRTFEMRELAGYDRLRREIRTRYAGVPVGYSESIFQLLGDDLGLRLLTPYGFAKAVAEGTDVTASEKETVDRQAQRHEIAVWIYNSQNVTPDVQRVTSIVRAQHIPIATVTETLSPAGASFQQWQTGELEGLLAALHGATGR